MKITNFETRIEMLRTMPKGGIVAEVGVYKGDFSREILNIIRPDELHLIDPWRFDRAEFYELVCQEFSSEGCVHIHRGFSHDILPSFDDRYFDWIYIDARHLYDHVKRDIELCMPLVKTWLLGHDFQTQKMFFTGVSRAVIEAIQNDGWIMVAITDNDDLSSWGLKQPGSSWVLSRDGTFWQ
jgi:hypothetical protein